MMEWRNIDGVGRVAFNQLSPRELAQATGLSADLQRVWRRRGHLPVRNQSRAVFDAEDVAAIMVRYELSKLGVAPGDASLVSDVAAPILLYFVLLSSDFAFDIRGGLKRWAEIAEQFEEDDDIARRISGVSHAPRYLWSANLPEFQFVEDFAAILLAERYPAMLLLDLAVVGGNLAANSPKPLFLIDVAV